MLHTKIYQRFEGYITQRNMVSNITSDIGPVWGQRRNDWLTCRFNPNPADHDYCRFKSDLLVGEMCA